MNIFLPVSAIEGIQRAQLDADQERADKLVDQLLAAVAAQTPSMVEVVTEEGDREEGPRKMIAAVFLLRACELLKEVRSTEDEMLQSLGLRTVFELAVVGRYLLVDDHGADEFRRRVAAAMADEERMARAIKITSPGAPDFLAHVVADEQKSPRKVKDIADALDRIDGRRSDGRFSAAHAYLLTYAYVSNAGTHANVLSAKRFLKREGALLSIEPNPPPIFQEPAVLLVACFVRELADAVLMQLGLPTTGLPEELRRPRRTGSTPRTRAPRPAGSGSV
jgi:hypothetical protein